MLCSSLEQEHTLQFVPSAVVCLPISHLHGFAPGCTSQSVLFVRGTQNSFCALVKYTSIVADANTFRPTYFVIYGITS